MGKYGGFKSEKRKKENARIKKQEEKRKRRFGLKAEEDSGEQEVLEENETAMNEEPVQVELPDSQEEDIKL